MENKEDRDGIVHINFRVGRDVIQGALGEMDSPG